MQCVVPTDPARVGFGVLAHTEAETIRFSLLDIPDAAVCERAENKVRAPGAAQSAQGLKGKGTGIEGVLGGSHMTESLV